MTRERLAIDGGAAVVAAGPPAWPPPDNDVQQALKAAYLDGSWGRYHGRHSDALVLEMQRQLAVEHVSLCCSGTMAVELALRGLKVGPGDEVLLAGYDFPGNFRAVAATGALPVLIDVAPGSVVIDLTQLDTARSSTTRAIVVSHLHGCLAPIVEIMRWAKAHGVAVVEDACQAVGATIDGRAAGTLGDVGTLSFGGSKLLTAGRGGAVVTDLAEVQQRIKVYSEQGNHAFPLSELQAAVLLPQWQKLAARHRRRQHAAERLAARLSMVEGLACLSHVDSDHDASFYKLAFRYDADRWSGHTRDEFVAALAAEGVDIGGGFRGFANRGAARCRKVGDLPHSRAAAEQVVLLHHPVLLESDDRLDLVARAVEKLAAAWQR